jgi:hypothetical protein
MNFLIRPLFGLVVVQQHYNESCSELLVKGLVVGSVLGLNERDREREALRVLVRENLKH